MVRLVGNDTIEEINSYFDLQNNFPQLLEDYIKKSGEVQELFNKSKDNNRSHFNRLMKYQLKKLYEQNTDEDPPRIKLFKTWMSNKYEQKQMKHKNKDNDLEKDELIRNLKNELLKKDQTIIQLKNENKHYCQKINKLRKQLNLDKPKKKLVPIVPKEPIVPEPERVPEREPEPETKSIYSNHLTEQEEKDKDVYEQNLKAQCELVAKQHQEDIENKKKTLKILDTYYSQCDLEIDKMEKKFNKEVKKPDRTNKNIKNHYLDSLQDLLYELQEEYDDNHQEISALTGDDYKRMISRPLDLFYDRLPSEMKKVICMNADT